MAEHDGFSAKLCENCFTLLQSAYHFKLQCEQSDIKMRGILPDQTDSYLFESEIEIIENYETDQTDLILVCDEGDSIPELMLTFPAIQNQTAAPTLTNIRTKKVKTTKIPKKHQCDTCGKIFKTKQGLIQHLRIHSGERPYACSICHKCFINGGHLHTHMRTHTGEKKHPCLNCVKTFATAQQLQKHIRAIHTQERPFQCSFCTKRCASTSNLSTHIRIHTGEKNHQCSKCPKAFATKGQLLQHILTHTGDKPFLCGVCNKRFTQGVHLKRHMQIHSKTSTHDSSQLKPEMATESCDSKRLHL